MTTRVPLPLRRRSETFNLRHWNQDWNVTVGYYSDGRPGEIFINGAKSGADLEGTARDGAVLMSLALQYRVPVEVMQHAVTRNENGAPSSIVGAILDELSKERS